MFVYFAFAYSKVLTGAFDIRLFSYQGSTFVGLETGGASCDRVVCSPHRAVSLATT